MCGIAGIVGRRDEQIDAAEVRAASALVLRERPVDCVGKVGGLRARRLNLARLCRGTRLSRRRAVN